MPSTFAGACAQKQDAGLQAAMQKHPSFVASKPESKVQPEESPRDGDDSGAGFPDQRNFVSTNLRVAVWRPAPAHSKNLCWREGSSPDWKKKN